METNDLQTVINGYLQAFGERDIDRCVSHFSEDAEIDFVMGTYRGKKDIEQWHQDRFNADMRVLRVDAIEVNGTTATVDLAVTSKWAKVWRMNSVDGRATLDFEAGKIKQAKFGLRTAIPIERW